MLKLAGILILAIVLTSLFSPIVTVSANDYASDADEFNGGVGGAWGKQGLSFTSDADEFNGGVGGAWGIPR